MTQPQPLLPSRPNFYYQHEPFLSHALAVSMTNIKKGMILEFVYLNKIRHVYVLNPNWRDQMHGISMHSIPREDLLKIIKWVPQLTEKVLYQQHIHTPHMKKLDAYRTFDLSKMHGVKVVQYEIPQVL